MKSFYAIASLLIFYVFLRFLFRWFFAQVEPFTDFDVSGEKLCALYSTQPAVLNNKCNMLTQKNCQATSCCFWAQNQRCVAGTASGPTFHTKNQGKSPVV
jgi:hypothetical protein